MHKTSWRIDKQDLVFSVYRIINKYPFSKCDKFVNLMWKKETHVLIIVSITTESSMKENLIMNVSRLLALELK